MTTSERIDFDRYTDEDFLDPDEVRDGGDVPEYVKAGERVDFQLTYTRSPVARVFSRDELTGANIDDARRAGRKSVGSWTIGETPQFVKDDTPENWIRTYVQAAIQEGIHEVLEWLKVDGEMWIDPHGPMEQDVMDEVETLFKRLAARREGRIAAASKTEADSD